MKNLIMFTLIVALLAASSSSLLAGADRVGDLQSTVNDGPVKVTIRVDKRTARIAEPIHLVFEVEAPRGARIELPPKVTRLGEFEVRRSDQTNDIPSASEPNKRTWIIRATLESIKTGDLSIPPLEIHYTTDAGATTLKTLSTAPIPIRVTSVLENRADPTKFHDIKQTVDVPVPESTSRNWIAWACGGSIAAAAALLLVTIIRKRQRRGPSPAAWAQANIAELEQLDVSKMGAESLFNEVVDIVREYFELEFNVPTLRRTTREFLAQASGEVGLPETAGKRLQWLASVADEIKFARLGVSEEHLQHAFAQSKAFIAECEAFRLTLMKGAA